MFLPTVISALTCSLPVEDQSQKEISIAKGVQATLNAEKVIGLRKFNNPNLLSKSTEPTRLQKSLSTASTKQ